MLSIFVDTAAWIALTNANDHLHQRALKIMKELEQKKARLITTEFILLEVADALSSPLLRIKTIHFVDTLRTNPLVEILPASSELLREGWVLYSDREDKEWGWTDCTSFAVMNERELWAAFTSDHHFEQAGFQKLL